MAIYYSFHQMLIDNIDCFGQSSLNQNLDRTDVTLPHAALIVEIAVETLVEETGPNRHSERIFMNLRDVWGLVVDGLTLHPRGVRVILIVEAIK